MQLDLFATNSYTAYQLRRIIDTGILNVWDFRWAKPSGVMCDGTDDFPAWAAARDSVASGLAVHLHVPRGDYILSTPFVDNGRYVTVDQEAGATITGTVFVTRRINRLIPRTNIDVRGTPSGGYQTIGDVWNITNTSASTVGYGMRLNYINDGTPASGFDVAFGMVVNFKGLTTGAQALANWHIYHGPNNNTWQGGFVWGELNPVNRGPDMGWANKPGALPRWCGGIRFVPESQDATGDGGTGRNVTFAYTAARSGSVNIDGTYAKTYTIYMVEPDAVAPGGYAGYWNGSTSGTPTDWYTFLGAQDTFKAGINLTGATFQNNAGLMLDVGDKVSWFSAGSEVAYTLGASGYLTLFPGTSGYITANFPDASATGGNARGANAVDLSSVRTQATRVASGQYSTVTGGKNNAATNVGSVSIGGEDTIADGRYGVVSGAGSRNRTTYGKFAHAPGQFASGGDSQIAWQVPRVQTTNATTTAMTPNNGAVASDTAIVLPNNGVYAFTAEVVARDTSTNDCAMWTVSGLIKRGANAAATALVGSPTVTKPFSDAGAAAWTLTATAETTQGSVQLNATGEAGKTIRWVANLRTTEVA